MSAKRIVLSNKPLVEAIFEVRWELKESEMKSKYDPHYPLLIGSLYDKVKENYPIHEQLPTSKIPHEMAEYVVQHRFKHEDNWPLMQIGPGIFTFNNTDKYEWGSYSSEVNDAFLKLCDSYPDKDDFKINRLQLRYIDAFSFDFNDNALDFLSKNLKFQIDIKTDLFSDVKIDSKPSFFDIRLQYNAERPKGIISLRFGRGESKDKSVILMDTTIISKSPDVPQEPVEIMAWMTQAHDLANIWFFKLIEGQLLEDSK